MSRTPSTPAAARVDRVESHRCDQRNEDARTLLATAAHELRTPLTSLHIRLDLLAEALAGEAPDITDAREQAERAAAQSRALIRLANALLQLTTAGAADVGTVRPVQLHELAREVIGELDALRAPAVNIKLDAAGPVWALGDKGAVAQILRTLLDNALRFAPAGTPIIVSVGRRGRRCEVTVRDWGPGIPEADRERIFGRFPRSGQARPDGHFGLGLAIGRDLARRVRGDLRLTSAARPTSFTLELVAARSVIPRRTT